MNKGMVFDIQRFALNDGPGIRTTVFLKGCPLHCAWCHNPESISPQPQLGFFEDRCTHCGMCVPACPNQVHDIVNGKHVLQRGRCASCGSCVSACPNNALVLTGREMSVDEVMGIVIRDKLYYDNSGGGLTLSGGEPLQQSVFALELLRAARGAGIHTCVDTSGYVPEKVLKQIVNETNLFLFDYKATNMEKHRELTGRQNTRIMQNLKLLHDLGKDIIIRCPVIPGVNDEEAHLNSIRNLVNIFPGVRSVQLLPYHAMGNAKYKRYGMDNPLINMESKGSASLRDWVREQHCPRITIQD